MRIVRSLAFHTDGVSFDYADPDLDVRENGLISNHVLLVPFSDQYADQIEALMDAGHALLGAALEDFTTTPVRQVMPEDRPDFDDDAPGPYDNPDDGGGS